MIDLRSFSSIWYWVLVAITWSTVTGRVLGVPTDLILRAKKSDGQAEVDLSDMVRITVNRQHNVTARAGLLLLAIVCFVLTMLAALGFIYRVEMAQAIFLVAFPLTLVGASSLSTGRLIQATQAEGPELYRILNRQRTWSQIIAVIAIFVTALFGMYQNLAVVRFL